MKTKEEREKAFREDLRQLLLRHNADFEIDEEGEYDEIHGVVYISMPRERDSDGNITFERCDFTLHRGEYLLGVQK